MKFNTKHSLFLILIILLPFSCSKKASLVGAYDLISAVGADGQARIVDPTDWTLKLIINPEGKYVLSEIEDGKEQGTSDGNYVIENSQIRFTNFLGMGDAVFDFRYENDILTLKLVSLSGNTEHIPSYSWTFKRI